MAAYRDRSSQTIEQLLTIGFDLDAGDPARAAQGHRVQGPRCPRLEALGRAGGDVETEPACEVAIELERGVDVGKMDVGADLDRAVARVHEDEPDALGLAAVGIQLYAPRLDAVGARAL